jgi:hypothetical protein
MGGSNLFRKLILKGRGGYPRNYRICSVSPMSRGVSPSGSSVTVAHALGARTSTEKLRYDPYLVRHIRYHAAWYGTIRSSISLFFRIFCKRPAERTFYSTPGTHQTKHRLRDTQTAGTLVFNSKWFSHTWHLAMTSGAFACPGQSVDVRSRVGHGSG